MNKKIIPYLTAFILLQAICCGLMIAYPKAEMHLMLNEYHTTVGDVFFRYYTMLAEWPLYIIALIPLFYRKWRWTLFYAISEGVAAIVIRLLKITFSEPRPIEYFKGIHDASLPLVDGVMMHHSNSFPSGHASTFFLFFTFAALLLTNKSKDNDNKISTSALTLLFFVLAALGCYSRIYLSQHFLSDVCVGSLIGVVVPCLMFFFFCKKILA